MARILVVDDEPDICEILQEILHQAGHQVRVAPDGDSALAVLRGEPFDLILTDIFMPGKEGIETIMEIRRDFPGIKIIAMSGGGRSGELHYLEDAIELGAVRTLFKPFHEGEVLKVVGAALGA
jgi:CheY-like chemotaxis protein